MPNDFRVAVDFQDHPKIVRLVGQYGNDGFVALMQIWAFAAKYRHKGALTRMTPKDICIAARWSGDADEFVSFLVEIGLLDKRRNGQYFIHGWAERNGFIFNYPQRRKQAKLAAKRKATNGHNDLRRADQKLNGPNKGAPTPTPTPNPNPTPTSCAADVDNSIKERREQFGKLTHQYAYQLEMAVKVVAAKYNKTVRDGIELVKSHLGDMEDDFVANPDKWANPVEKRVFGRFCVGWQNGEWTLGDYGLRTPITSSEEQTHYRKHRRGGAKTDFETIGDPLPQGGET